MVYFPSASREEERKHTGRRGKLAPLLDLLVDSSQCTIGEAGKTRLASRWRMPEVPSAQRWELKVVALACEYAADAYPVSPRPGMADL